MTRTHRRGATAGLVALWLVGQAAVASPALATPGDLDTSFDVDGKVTVTPEARPSRAADVVVQPDGKIVAVGTAQLATDSAAFTAARFNPDGTLDTAFGGDGMVTVNVAAATEAAEGVVLQTIGGDTKIVIGGWAVAGGGNSNVALVRLNSNGSLDTTFSGDGIATELLQTGDKRAWDVATQPDNKIVLVGGAFGAVVTRFTSSGALDTAFSGDGILKIGTAFSEAQAVGVQSDGKIVVAGNDGADMLAARITTAGALDTSFSGDGIATVDFAGSADKALDLSVDARKVLTIGGYARVISGGVANYDFALARFTATGAPDRTFSADGKTNFDMAGNNNDAALGMGLSAGPDCKTAVAGGTSVGTSGDWALARLNKDGSLDTSFSGDGKLTQDIDGLGDRTAEEVVHQADGNLVAAGAANSGKITLARFLGGSAATVSVSDATVTEPDSGSVTATFTVTLSASSTSAVKVSYATVNKTARAPGDYTTKRGTVTIPAGATSATVAVPVVGDTLVEPNETFQVTLSCPSNAGLADGIGVGTIVNDD